MPSQATTLQELGYPMIWANLQVAKTGNLPTYMQGSSILHQVAVLAMFLHFLHP